MTNVLPEAEWLCNDVIIWKKVERPSTEKIQHCLEGELDGIGTLEWRDPFFYIKLPGTPKSLRYGPCTFVENTSRSSVREIYVVLEKSKIFVKSATQDNMTLRIAEALSGMFYGIQGYQDHAFEPDAAED